MNKRIKQVGLVILVQSGCLAVGLWMQHHYTVTSVERTAEDEAWSDIESRSKALGSALEGIAIPDPATHRTERTQLTQRLNARLPGRGDWMVVDRHWHPLLSDDEPAQQAAPEGALRPRIDWMPTTNASRGASRPLRGTLELPDGPHIAAAYPLRDGRGFVVAHQSLAAIQARTASVIGSLPALSVMTFVWTCALLGIAVYVIVARLHDDMDHERSRSATEALRQTQNLIRTRDAVIFGLAKLAESRDPDTGDHLERISLYSTTLASALRRHPRFRSEITPGFIRLIGISSALHDIGKVGVEDRILLKPGPLTPEERRAMELHAAIGGDCLKVIEQRLGGSNFLQMAREIAFCHHENWDGTGYPQGLSGAAIPLSARIVAVADIYDALSSRRVYKEAFPHERCAAIIREEAGKKLDPHLVEIWLTIESRFRRIARKYGNSVIDGGRNPPVQPGAPNEVEREIEQLCAM